MLVDVKQYANLIQTISFLLKYYKPREGEAVSPTTENDDNGGNRLYTNYIQRVIAAQICIFLESFILMLAGDVVLPKPAFLMSWRRRIGKEDESLFFNGCESAGLEVQHIGSRVYCIKPRGNEKS